MSKSKINNFSIEALLEKIDYKSFNDSRMLFNTANLLDVVTDFNALQKVILEKHIDINKAEPLKIVLDNPKWINKEKFILVIVANLNYILTKVNDPIEEIKLRNSFNVCTDLLQGCDTEVPVISANGNYLYIKDFVSANVFTGEKSECKNSHQKERNLQVVEKMEKEGFFEKLDLIGNVFEDFDDVICYDRVNGSLFRYIISNNSMNFCFEQGAVSQNENYKKYVASEIEQILKKYSDKLDMNKFLLACAANVSRKLDADLEHDEIKRAIEVLDFASENITGKNAKISTKTSYGTSVEYSTKILEKYRERTINGENYISESGLEKLRQMVLDGVIVYRSGSNADLMHKYWNLMNFTDKEKRQMMLNEPEDIKYIYENEGLTQEQLRDIFENIKNHEFDMLFIDFLYEDGAIEKQDIINLYKNENLPLSSIRTLDELHNLKDEVTVDELMNYYENTKENPDEEYNFERYMLLFKELKVKNQTEERKSQLEEQIVEKIYEINENEYADDFVSLYKKGLLSIDTLMDWNGEDVVYSLIKQNSLKPKDARELLAKGEFDVKKAYQALKTSDLTETEKMNFIFGSFDGSGNNEDEIKLQNEARMYLIQAMNVSKELKNEEGTTDSNFVQGTTKTKNDQKRYLLDPAYRWRFYSELDDDCTYDNCLDGTVVCTLPNLNGGTVFFEQIFENTKKGVRIKYGAAIYLTSIEEFLKHKDEIIVNGKFNRTLLGKMKVEDRADKFIHSQGYANQIKTKLNISTENGYDQEKMKRIDAIIDKIEKSRELIK